jgi:hypothetical protein
MLSDVLLIVVVLNVVIQGIVYAECQNKVYYTECRSAECCYAECHYAVCHYAACRILSIQGSVSTAEIVDT